MKKALIIGASGLVGKEIVLSLLEIENYQEVSIFVRKLMEIEHIKLKQIVCDFEQIEQFQEELKGDVIFSAFGTTLKTAGSKEKQYHIDVELVLSTLKLAKNNNVKTCCLVSTIGANSSSKNFYLKMKGELEEKIIALNFDKTIFHRPSILDGNRTEKRTMEKIGLSVIRFLAKLGLMGKYKPIHATTVAKALINSCEIESGKAVVIYERNEMETVASAI